MLNDDIGPDLVIAGAARSGTSYLSAMLGRHSRIDPGALKEPGFFSGRWSKGREWYDNQFAPRTTHLMRLDSTVAYTYPQYPEALKRLRAMAPHVKIIYAVREPIGRFVSMYQFYRYYIAPDRFKNLGEALEAESEMCLVSGDYSLWLERLADLFPVERTLVVPFPLITGNPSAVLDILLPWLGLRHDEELVAGYRDRERNEVRQLRWRSLERWQTRLRAGRFYLTVRSAIGQDRLRTVRRLATRRAAIPTPAEELASLNAAQRRRLDAVAGQAVSAASDWLRGQDSRFNVAWADAWKKHVEGGSF